MIAIIDYKAGNIASLCAALDRLKQEYIVTNDPDIITKADRVIFPGQGRAGQAMQEIQQLNLQAVIQNLQVPFLGICLGMQLLAKFSEEDATQGLSIIPVQVKKFSGKSISAQQLRVPHMGWNTLQLQAIDPILKDIPNNSAAYFVHSYYMEADSRYTLATTNYGDTAAVIVRNKNFYGMQFHPEKSGVAGMQLLENFCALTTKQLSLSSQPCFEIWPALDLLNGQCVRLQQGDYNQVTQYTNNPLSVIQQFVTEGATGIHMVDLSGAKVGKPLQQDFIIELAQSIIAPVEVGGGIRTVETAQKYLRNGIARVVLGTAAIEHPELVSELIKEFGPDRVSVSLDVRKEYIATHGWQHTTKTTVQEVITNFVQRGVKRIIITDIQRDGMLQGLDTNLLKILSNNDVEYIVGGGISTEKDLITAKQAGMTGVIIGKALYEGKVTVKKCVQALLAFQDQVSNLKYRIIPCLDITNGRVVKGTNFTQLRDAGDPVALAKLYSELGADELVFLDITATVEHRKQLYDFVHEVAANVTIPFTVGGGIKSIEDIRALLLAGADKVSIGSAAVYTPELVQNASQHFGNQCIVISLDAKRVENHWEIYIKGGREAIGVDAIEFAQQMQVLGAGELLVNSLDRDGTKQGYDIPLLKAISEVVTIPVIASSGVGKVEDFLELFQQTTVTAALAASVFHFQELTLAEVKHYLQEHNISVRL